MYVVVFIFRIVRVVFRTGIKLPMYCRRQSVSVLCIRIYLQQSASVRRGTQHCTCGHARRRCPRVSRRAIYVHAICVCERSVVSYPYTLNIGKAFSTSLHLWFWISIPITMITSFITLTLTDSIIFTLLLSDRISVYQRQILQCSCLSDNENRQQFLWTSKNIWSFQSFSSQIRASFRATKPHSLNNILLIAQHNALTFMSSQIS